MIVLIESDPLLLASKHTCFKVQQEKLNKTILEMDTLKKIDFYANLLTKTNRQGDCMNFLVT